METGLMEIYLHETIRTVPGQEEQYIRSILGNTQRPGRENPPRQLGQFRTADTSGAWPLAVNYWRHTWETQKIALAGQFGGGGRRDVALEHWWNRNLHLRRGGYDRMLFPTAYTLDAEGLRATEVRGRIFLQEILWLPLGRVSEFLQELQRRFLPIAKRYEWQLVGAYRVLMRPRQALTLFAFREWEALSALLDARERDSELRGWLGDRDRWVQEVEELVLLPSRLNPLGIRD